MLKDWKKTHDTGDVIFYKKKKKKLTIMGDYRGWLVTFPTKPIKYKNCITKAQAIKFAKDYMKKN